MDITVAICTRNRAASLDNTLASIADIQVPARASYEVLVVNNQSTDDTDSVIDLYRDRLPIRRAFEPAPGLSNARNRAVAEARGSFIVWTDDDVIVDRNWLKAYAEAFHRYPQASLFGGKVLPKFEEPVPSWLKQTWPLVAGAFAYVDFGNEPLPISLEPRRVPFGANFAVRAREQKMFPYDPKLGLGPGKSLLGEEVTVIESIINSGGTGRMLPDAIVNHCMPLERQTKQYIENYYKALGRTYAYNDKDNSYKTVFGIPLWILRKMLNNSVSYWSTKYTAPEDVHMAHFIDYAQTRGALEFYRLHKP